jgi:methylglyoxal/glyoxal reductase
MVSMTDNNLSSRLNNGVLMPMLGLGVYNMHGKQAEEAVLTALELGYRLIDTAAMYRNEASIGMAMRHCGLPRKELFITTKLHNEDQGYEATLRAFDQSLDKLGTDYIDLYLIHWPLKATRKESWKALEKIYSNGKAKAIGVANYLLPFLEELSGYAAVTPAVNQVEFGPYLYLKELLAYCKLHQIQLQAYSPLSRGKILHDPKLLAIAEKYNKTAAQVILRWDLQMGVSAIPKSINPDRLKENLDIAGFSLSTEDVESMKTFNQELRVVDDPMGYL